MNPSITIDNAHVPITPGQTVLQAARSIGLDIPTLCYLEKCGPLNSCQVCLVKINGKMVPSCGTVAQPGMVVESETEEVHEARRTALELLFSDHVGDCLSPCNRLCPLGLNIPLMLRQIEAGQLSEASATMRASLPLAGILGRLCHHPCEQGCRRGHWDEPAAIRDLERHVADWEMGLTAPQQPSSPTLQALQGRGAPSASSAPAALPFCQPPTGKSVVVVGAGPAGLTAAYSLARQGHRVTVVDRQPRAGGSLLRLPEAELPPEVLQAETDLLLRMGIQFRLGLELGAAVTVEALLRECDALLLAVGELNADDAPRLGLAVSGAHLHCDPNTARTSLAKVFAAGAAVKSVPQLVRAMADGRSAAECIHRFLTGQRVRRPEKPFSSVMGRLSPGELKQFLATASAARGVSPCDRCAGLNRVEAVTEAARCLHCDCRSSGNCVLQHYAQVYGADASRFRSERRPFEQQAQPGGVIFEPGKCILCGICVRLTELARESLGLTFIGRGFDVRVAAPFNAAIQEGLRRTAEECVRHCPTGALAFSDKPQSATLQNAESGRG
jgi:ferredoxin